MGDGELAAASSSELPHPAPETADVSLSGPVVCEDRGTSEGHPVPEEPTPTPPVAPVSIDLTDGAGGGLAEEGNGTCGG